MGKVLDNKKILYKLQNFIPDKLVYGVSKHSNEFTKKFITEENKKVILYVQNNLKIVGIKKINDLRHQILFEIPNEIIYKQFQNIYESALKYEPDLKNIFASAINFKSNQLLKTYVDINESDFIDIMIVDNNEREDELTPKEFKENYIGRFATPMILLDSLISYKSDNWDFNLKLLQLNMKKKTIEIPLESVILENEPQN